jgi:hypothetical protein
LQPEEAAVLAMLRARLKQAVDDGPARACTLGVRPCQFTSEEKFDE